MKHINNYCSILHHFKDIANREDSKSFNFIFNALFL